MNTASPRIPSPLDTAGMMAVVSAPGLAEQGTAQRGLAGGDREEKDPRQRQGAEPAAAGGGRAGGQEGWKAAGPPPAPPLSAAARSCQPPLAQVTAAQTRSLLQSLSHWPQDKGMPLRLVLRPAISVCEGALPKRRAEFDYARLYRPLRAAGSSSDWIRTLSCKGGIDVNEGGGAGLRRRDLC